ncbi:hypothetical protein ABW19_dt0207154 [Dactylella cylindrospora]|nr:hypothetical protein ABW19_dt0207154 [Dactylella cylindrospora]
MQRSGILATAARCRTTPSTLEHIWISETIVNNAFDAFSSRKTTKRNPRALVSPLSPRSFSEECIAVETHLNRRSRRFHTNHTSYSSSSSGSKEDGLSGTGGSLFSWGKSAPQFDHRSPRRNSIVRPVPNSFAVAIGGFQVESEDHSQTNVELSEPYEDKQTNRGPQNGTRAASGVRRRQDGMHTSTEWILIHPPKHLNELILSGTRVPSENDTPEPTPKHIQDIMDQTLQKLISMRPPQGKPSKPHAEAPLLQLPPPEPRLLITSGSEPQTHAVELELDEKKLAKTLLPLVLINPDGLLHEGMKMTFVPEENMEESGEDYEDVEYEDKGTLNLCDPAIASESKVDWREDDIKALPDYGERMPAAIQSGSGFEDRASTTELGPAETAPLLEKLVVRPEDRVPFTFLQKRDNVQARFKELLDDRKIDLQTVVLAYSQIDAIYGVENMPNPRKLIDDLYARFSGSGTERYVWLFHHPSVKLLKEKGLLSEKFLERSSRNTKAKGPPRTEVQYIDDSFKTTSVGVDHDWERMKEWAARRQEHMPSRTHCRLPIMPVNRLLDRAIKSLEGEEWTREKILATDTCIDIFLYYREMEMPLSMLFSNLVKFFQAWMRYWDNDSYWRLLRDQASERDSAQKPTMESSPTQPSPGNTQENLFRRVQYHSVSKYLLGANLPNQGRQPSTVPGVNILFQQLPRRFVDRLIPTILLRPVYSDDKLLATQEDWTKAWTLEKLQPFARFSRSPKRLELHKDKGLLPELSGYDSIYQYAVASKGDKAILNYLRHSSDRDIIAFHLRNWPLMYGPRYIQDSIMLTEIRNIFEEVILRIKRLYSPRPKLIARPYAQAVLSLFYLGLPTENFANDLIHTLAFAYRIDKLQSCIAILKKFEGQSNGEVVFKIPKTAMRHTLKSLHSKRPHQALKLLKTYHNRHSATFSDILADTAIQYPDQTHLTLRHFLSPMRVVSIWNPRIEFSKPEGRPSRKFLIQLAIRYAVSDNHSPNVATRRIIFIRHLMLKLGYPLDIRVPRALLAAAMIRSGTHRLWNGPRLESANDIFFHGRLRYAVHTFMRDAGKDPRWLEGLGRVEADEKKAEFVQKCMEELWDEIHKWKKEEQQYVAFKRGGYISVI